MGAVRGDRHPAQSGGISPQSNNQAAVQDLQIDHAGDVPHREEAIEAGTTWWEADLFAGNPDWKKLHAIPVSTLSAEEQAFMDGPVEEVCRMVSDWEVTHERADLSPRCGNT